MMTLSMPKRNGTASAEGHPAWRNVASFYQKAYKEFTKEYGRRNIVESVFGSIKQYTETRCACAGRKPGG